MEAYEVEMVKERAAYKKDYHDGTKNVNESVGITKRDSDCKLEEWH